MSDQPRLSNDLAFRAHELRGFSNAKLAEYANTEGLKSHIKSYWTGKAVAEYGRGAFIVSILTREGYPREEARKAMGLV